MLTTLPTFDREFLELAPLTTRKNDLGINHILPKNKSGLKTNSFQIVAEKIVKARSQKSAVVLMMGAHVLRAGVQRYLIDMMEKGQISCVALNGAGVIHDFEFALIGATTESVAHYIKDGRFGFWQETSYINDIVSSGAEKNMGLGAAVGRAIEKECFPHREISILAAGYRLNIPVTVHVGIGYDIVYQLPNCNGAAYGAASYADFLRYASVLESLENGVVMNFGSAIMAPEVFLKGLSMARNSARQKNKTISRFTTLVCDLANLPENYREEPARDNPLYYFRPWKTMLIRTVADGGESFYVRGNHAQTIPELWSAIYDLDR